MKHPGVSYTITLIVLFILVVSLCSCAAGVLSGPERAANCESQGGVVFSVGNKRNCVLDGAVVDEWWNE